MGKRIFDLILATAGLLLTWPLLVFSFVAIKLDDGGPWLFRQIRIGRAGRPFQILKIRTMRPHAAGPSVTARGDPRVTRVGHWLRQTKLDELPQLWNVLVGEMSMVGPRPEVPRYVEMYSPSQREVLRLRPGITDEASIEFRDEEKLLADAPEPEAFYIEHCIPRKIAINLAYARKASVARDIGVILRTLMALLQG